MGSYGAPGLEDEDWKHASRRVQRTPSFARNQPPLLTATHLARYTRSEQQTEETDSMANQDRAAGRRREADAAAKKSTRSIDDYLQTIEASRRAALERIRALAHEIVPGAQEAIMYG